MKVIYHEEGLDRSLVSEEQFFKNTLKKKFSNKYSEVETQICLLVEPDEILEVATSLHFEFDFNYFIDFFVIGGGSKVLVYRLRNLKQSLDLELRSSIDKNAKIPSLAQVWPAARWCELEAQESHQLIFDGHKSNHFFFGDEKFETYKRNQSIVSLSLKDRAMISSFEIQARLQGELISEVITQRGFQHKGLEKKLVKRELSNTFPMISALSYLCPVISTTAWAMGIEKFSQIEIPDRAKAIRMVCSELSRIHSHIYQLYQTFLQFGLPEAVESCLELRLITMNLFESYSGGRVHPLMNCIGGIRSDLPKSWITEVVIAIRKIDEGIKRILQTYSSSEGWIKENSIGVIKDELLFSYGFSGPNLRASGLNIDIRKSRPYYFYDQVDFDLPIGTEGTNYDRFLVRCLEIQQSLKIMSQILDNLPAGKVCHEDFVFKKDFSNKEDLIKYLELSRSSKILTEDLYVSVEGAEGEFGFYMTPNSDGELEFLKVRSPSFFHYQGFVDFICGMELEQAETFLCSLGISFCELER